MSELLIYFFMECCTLPVIKGFFDVFLDKRNLGKKVWIFREEPFLFAEDSIECGVYLLIWERKGRNTQTVIEKVEVEEVKSGSDKR